MDISWGPVIIAALIGAAAPIIPARLAVKQAKKDQESAERLNSRGHLVNRIDTQAEELRAACKNLAETFSTGNLEAAGAAAEVLALCQGATPKLREECRSISLRWASGGTLLAHYAEIGKEHRGFKMLHSVLAAHDAAQEELKQARDALTAD